LQYLKDSFLQEVLLRAEAEVDNMIGSTFTDGTVSNPDYPIVLNEYHDSQGFFNRDYYSWQRPVIDITSDLASDITISATSLTVTTGDGVKFPSSGYVIVGSEIIQYSGITSNTLTGLTRGSLGSSAAAHTTSEDIHTAFVQVSGTDEGGVPSWYTLSHESEMSIDDNGKVFIYDDTLYNNLVTGNNLLFKQDVPKRFRMTYLYGWDTIPKDITRLTLLIAAKDIIHMAVRKAHAFGLNDFRPALVNVDNDEIIRIASFYHNLDMNNT